MSDLLPCPFCGCANLRIEQGRMVAGVRREKIRCLGCWVINWREAWNRRTPASTVLPDRAPVRDTPIIPEPDFAGRVRDFNEAVSYPTSPNAREGDGEAIDRQTWCRVCGRLKWLAASACPDGDLPAKMHDWAPSLDGEGKIK
jgi:hypothetical protein